MTDVAPRLPNSLPEHLAIGLLPWESQEDFEALYLAYHGIYAPSGPAQVALVDQLAWLDWRRRRLRVAERALHMASLERNVAFQRNDRLTQRALVTCDISRPDTSSEKAVESDDASDSEQVEDWSSMLESAERARDILEEHREDGIEAALEALPVETREWFEETAAEEDTRFPANLDGLQRFLIVEVLPFFRSSLEGFRVGPAIRRQAWGESFDPERMDKLLSLDERLGRQFEKTMSLYNSLLKIIP
ncbi:MAG: hypothetical protein ACON4C_07265 [Henriciella sp.]